jgi:hypothetical protein
VAQDTKEMTMTNTKTMTKRTSRITRRLALAALAAMAGPVVAQVHEGDIILDTSTGQIRAGAISAGAFEERSIFLTLLGENAPNVSSDPGFDCTIGSFPVGARNGLTLIGPLQEWNGTSFAPSDAEYLRVEYLTLATDGPAPTASPEQEIDTFTISVQANGQWHRHVRWVLRDGPVVGVYAQRMRVRCDAGTPAPSNEFYLLINQGGAPQGDIDASAAWLETLINGGGGCPVCAADFDGNGGVDGGDLGAFFAAFETGDACTDVDGNGGVDGGDLGAFFAAFESGGC